MTETALIPTNGNRKLSAAQTRELLSDIRAREANIKVLLGKVGVIVQAATGEAILQGADLLRLQYGNEKGSLKNLIASTGISQERANKYVAAALKPDLLADIGGPGTLARAICLVDDRVRQVRETAHCTWPEFVKQIHHLSRFTKGLRKLPLKNFPKEGIARVKELLRPIVAELWPDRFQRLMR